MQWLTNFVRFSRHSFLMYCKLKRATSGAIKRHAHYVDHVRESDNTISLPRDAKDHGDQVSIFNQITSLYIRKHSATIGIMNILRHQFSFSE